MPRDRAARQLIAMIFFTLVSIVIVFLIIYYYFSTAIRIHSLLSGARSIVEDVTSPFRGPASCHSPWRIFSHRSVYLAWLLLKLSRRSPPWGRKAMYTFPGSPVK